MGKAVPLPVIWRANPGPQDTFLRCSVYEALYGGAAGGGKSDALLAAATRYIGEPSYAAILFRRTYPELEKSLVERSLTLYRRQGGRYNDQKKMWRFPSGARIMFGHMEHEKDKLQYQGAEFQFCGFDELTHFTESQYLYLMSRLRSSQGLPCFMRGSSNPGGPGHEWVMRRWAAWLDPAYEGKRAAAGEARAFVRDGESEVEVQIGSEGSLARTFIPAKVADNPHLAENDPGYVARLKTLDVVTRRRLLDGDWAVRPARGLYFKRGWISILDGAQTNDIVKRVRYWDRAATDPAEVGDKRDPDWTIGVKLSKTSRGLYIVEHVARERAEPHEIERLIKNTAQQDGQDVEIGLEQEPGASGKFEVKYYIRELAGYNIRAWPATGDKITRAGPVSAQAAAGNIKLVRGAWNEPFLATLESFPEGHDDDVDALSGAFSVLNPISAGDSDFIPVGKRRW